MDYVEEIVGYWTEEGWVLYNDDAIILKNESDTTKYKFYNKLPIDKDGIPRIKPVVTNKNSFRINLYYNEIMQSYDVIIKKQWW